MIRDVRVVRTLWLSRTLQGGLINRAVLAGAELSIFLYVLTATHRSVGG